MKEEKGKTEENGTEDAEKKEEKEEKKEKVKKKRSFRSFSFLRREKKHKEAKEAKDKNGEVSTVFVWVPACCVWCSDRTLVGSAGGAGGVGCMRRRAAPPAPRVWLEWSLPVAMGRLLCSARWNGPHCGFIDRLTTWAPTTEGSRATGGHLSCLGTDWLSPPGSERRPVRRFVPGCP